MAKRSQHKTWVLMGLLFAAGVGVATALKGRRPKLKEGQRVLLVGDSLAVGLSPHLKSLAKEAGIEMRALAKTGTRIDQWADSAELASVLNDWSPDVVLVSLGTNDAALGKDAAARQSADLDRLLEKFRLVRHRQDFCMGADLVWIGPPTLPFDDGGMRALLEHAVKDYSSDLSSCYASSYFHSDEIEIPRGPDDLHPTAAGYAGWTGAIWSFVT